MFTTAATRVPVPQSPLPSSASSAARFPPADAPNAPIRAGSMLSRLTCSGARNQRTAARTSSSGAGKLHSGASR